MLRITVRKVQVNDRCPPAGWTVYILRCADGSLYTGATNDLARRLARHSAGRGAAYTRSRLPVKVVFTEAAEGVSAALKREAAIKKLDRAEKLQLLKVRRRKKKPVSASAREALPARGR